MFPCSLGEGIAEDGDWIAIGRVTKSFGLKGGFKVYPLTGDPGRFEGLAQIELASRDGLRKICAVTDIRIENKAVVLFCRELGKIEDIEPFIGAAVRVPREEAIPLPKDSYFQHDLLGLKVYLEDGRYLGEVKEILETGSNDVLVVRESKQEYLIPAIKSVVTSVDLERKRMVLHPMKGLLEK